MKWPNPKRDLLLIPLISLLTVLILAAGVEVVARFAFEESGKETCGRGNDRTGLRFEANCTSRLKSTEGPWVENRYNACGYRQDEPCGDRPPGSYRIALLGGSTSQGYKVPYEQAMAPRMAARLSQGCGRPVEVQNLSVAGFRMIDQYLKLDEALALKPDVVMLFLSSYELVDLTDPALFALRGDPARLRSQREQVVSRPPAAFSVRDVLAVDRLVAQSRGVVAAQHLLYLDRARYVRLFLLNGDKVDYLRSSYSERWEKRLSDLDVMLGEMAAKARAAGVPFVLVFGPQRIQAAMLDPSTVPAGFDPLAIDRRIADIARHDDIHLVDILSSMRDVENPERLFYPVDGHMTDQGHALLARTTVQQLLAQRIGVFADCH